MRKGIKLIATLGIAAVILSCSTGCSKETMDALSGLANTINDGLGQLGEAASAGRADEAILRCGKRTHFRGVLHGDGYTRLLQGNGERCCIS